MAGQKKCREERAGGLCGEGMCVMPYFKCKLYKPLGATMKKKTQKKTCPKCKRRMDATLENFAASIRSKDGLTMKCRKCLGQEVEKVMRPIRKIERAVGKPEPKTLPSVLKTSGPNGETHIHIHIHTIDTDALGAAISRG